MRVLHVISCLLESNGHSRFCIELAQSLSACDQEHEVFTLPMSRGKTLSSSLVPVLSAKGLGLSAFNTRLVWGGRRQIAEVICRFKPNVVHVHGGWHPILLSGARAARRQKVPVLLSLHGSLRPSIVEGDRRIIKRLAWSLYERRLVQTATQIHVSSAAEQGDLARLGFAAAAVVIPNGIDTRFFRGGPDREILERKWPHCQNRRIALFVGRLHPGKGLDLLIAAWERLGPDARGWHLLIAGPDEAGTYRRRLEQQVRQTGLVEHITLCGPLYGRERDRILATADLFVLPSHSENFGMAVAEAMASAVPVITTKGTPWAEVVGSVCDGEADDRCGWWVDVGVDPLVAALREAMGLSENERKAMGERGRERIEQRYGWDSTVRQFANTYRGLAGHI